VPCFLAQIHLGHTAFDKNLFEKRSAMKDHFAIVKRIAAVLVFASAFLSVPANAATATAPLVNLSLIQGAIPSEIRLELLGQGQQNSFRGEQSVYVIPKSAGGFQRGEKLS
jgi:hypothetical protein